MNRAGPSWLRIGAEFLIIVAGVSISLAAERWRQATEDREAEQTLLSGLEVDLESDAGELEALARNARNWDRTAQWVSLNEDRSDVPTDSVALMFQPFGVTSFYQPVRAAYSGAIGSGGISLILEDSLRMAVINYYEVRQPWILQFFNLVFDNWRKWYDISAPYLNWGIQPSDTTMFAAIRSSNPPELRESWTTISSDAAFMGHIDITGMLGGNASLRIDQALAENRALRERIRAQLER
ncbi:uncharacterized protein METZ01_LOCUS270121 [marine metagenome]|jgi:hypothetical protein|uniref:Uncharacterized protein n=1 Tax=marine metagenome TaxID=408172 RepID=A0A382K2E7_9ZZZZ